MIDLLALLLGRVVIVGVCGAAVLCALLLAWVYFPVRWQFSRDLPSHLDTPIGPYRLTALVGLSSRRRHRWFFGLMLLRNGEAPRARVVSRKREAA